MSWMDDFMSGVHDMGSIGSQAVKIATGQTTATDTLNDPNYQAWQRGDINTYYGPQPTNGDNGFITMVLILIMVMFGLSMLGGRRR